MNRSTSSLSIKANNNLHLLPVLLFIQVNLCAQIPLVDTLQFPITFTAASHSFDPSLAGLIMFGKSTQTAIGYTTIDGHGSKMFRIIKDLRDSTVLLALAPTGLRYIIGEWPIREFEETKAIEIRVHKVKFPDVVPFSLVVDSIHYLVEIRVLDAAEPRSYFYSVDIKQWRRPVRKALKRETPLKRQLKDIIKPFP